MISHSFGSPAEYSIEISRQNSQERLSKKIVSTLLSKRYSVMNKLITFLRLQAIKYIHSRAPSKLYTNEKKI